jgi:hypothetical protein
MSYTVELANDDGWFRSDAVWFERFEEAEAVADRESGRGRWPRIVQVADNGDWTVVKVWPEPEQAPCTAARET